MGGWWNIMFLLPLLPIFLYPYPHLHPIPHAPFNDPPAHPPYVCIRIYFDGSSGEGSKNIFSSKGAFDLELVQRKVNIELVKRFWCGEHPLKVTSQCMQFLRFYCVHKAAWSWASLKIQKGHKKVDAELIWDLDVENVPIKLQQCACKEL